MYNKFSKGEDIRIAETTRSSFPAASNIEAWSNSERRVYTILERPIRNLFENSNEINFIINNFQKMLNIGDENFILSGLDLIKTDEATAYVTLTPGIFVYNENIYSVYPTPYIASRQLEKDLELNSFDGTEYINITYENEKFNAVISIGGNNIPVAEATRGIELLNNIKAALEGASVDTTGLVNLEQYQLEPCFIATASTQFINFNGTEISADAIAGDFFFGSFTNLNTTSNDSIFWNGLITDSIKDDAITNNKLNVMPNLTIKGNVSGTSANPQDISEQDLINYFDMVDRSSSQTISGIKTFSADQKIENTKSLIFKDDSVETGWALVNDALKAFNIKNNTVTVISIEDDNDVYINSKDFILTSSSNNIGLDGNTKITGTFNTTEATSLDGTLEVTGATTLNNTLTVNGVHATTLGGTLGVTGATTLNNTLTVNGVHATTLGGTLGVTGATTLNNALTVNGEHATTLGGTLTVAGATTLNNNLTVSTGNATTLGGILGVAGATTLDNALTVNGEHATTLGGTLTVEGITALNNTAQSTASTNGALKVVGGVGIGKNLNVGGTLGITGNTTLGGTLSTTGISTFTGLIKANGGIAVNTNKFTVDAVGNTTLGGTLGVTGATTLNNTLTVNGVHATTLGGALTIAGATTLNDETAINGDFYVAASQNEKMQIVSGVGTTLIGGSGFELSEANGDTFHIANSTDSTNIFYVDTDEIYSNVATTLNNTLTVNGAYVTSLGGALTVTGITTLNNNLTVSTGKATSLGGTLAVAGITTLNNNLIVSTGKTTSLGGSLTVTGITTLNDNLTVSTGKTTSLGGALAVTGNTTAGGDFTASGIASLGGSLTVTGITTLNDNLIVSTGKTTTLGGTLGVVGITSLNNDIQSTASTNGALKVVGGVGIGKNLNVGGTLGITGTSSFTGKITATDGITSPSDIITTSAGSIASATTITAATTITSGTDVNLTNGNLNIKKRDFSINLGNSLGTTYDWTISKVSNVDVGNLEIKNSKAPTNGTFSIAETGIVKALEFRTNVDYALNGLNVEKFNGNTIENSSSSPSSSGTDEILWIASSGNIIKRTPFSSLPEATYKGDGVTTPPGDIAGLMTPSNLARIRRLENIAFPPQEGGEIPAEIQLVGSVNGESPDGPGGNVTIDTTEIYLDASAGELLSERLASNATDLDRIKGHVPAGTVASGTYEVMLKDGTTVSWGNISDSQLGTNTLTRVAPFSSETSRPLLTKEKPVALWNTDSPSLHRDNDVVFDTSSNTLTATNVTSRSSRTVKKDIETYSESAFDTLNQIEVVSFHYVSDETQADKVGFIAEDSPELVAGINHDKMEMGNCIGLLIKAVQELKKENEELREIINGYHRT